MKITCISCDMTSMSSSTPPNSTRPFVRAASHRAVNKNNIRVSKDFTCAKQNKAGYTATSVACGWVGAVFELLQHLARSSEAKDRKNIKKVKWGPTNRPTNRPTDRRTKCSTRLKRNFDVLSEWGKCSYPLPVHSVGRSIRLSFELWR